MVRVANNISVQLLVSLEAPVSLGGDVLVTKGDGFEWLIKSWKMNYNQRC